MGLDNPLHIAFLLVILLLVFGAKRLPEMGRSLGEGLRGFKDSISTDGNSHADHSHQPVAPIEHKQPAKPAALAASQTVTDTAPAQENLAATAQRTFSAGDDETAREADLAAR